MNFDLKKFVKKTLAAMRDGGEDSYKVMQYALKYYERSVLNDDDMAEIEAWYTPPADTSDDTAEDMPDGSADVDGEEV